LLFSFWAFGLQFYRDSVELLILLVFSLMGHSGTDYVVIWDRFLFLRFTLILLAIIVTGQVGQGKLYVYTHTHGGARHKGYI